MLHLLYILAFTILAFLAIANLIRSMVSLGLEAQRGYSGSGWSAANAGATQGRSRQRSVPHPEFLDDTGNVINEPLLVMRSMSVEDAREHLDALFDASPSQTTEPREET